MTSTTATLGPDRSGPRRFAAFMATATLIGAVALPLGAVAVWSFLGLAGTLTVAGVAIDTNQVDFGFRLMGLALSLVGAGIWAYGLLALRTTFEEAAAGRWLSLTAVTQFRRFAWVAVIMVFVQIVLDAGTAAVLTAAVGDGKVAIDVGTDDLGDLFMALLFVFAAHVFATGRAAEEENESFL